MQIRRAEHILTKAVAVALSLCLVMCLVPSVGFADGGTARNEGSVEGQALAASPLGDVDEGAPEGAPSDAPTPLDDTAVSAYAAGGESSALDGGSASNPSSGAPENSSSDGADGQLLASVELAKGQGASSEAAVDNGLTYVLDVEKGTATLSGWCGTAPKGDVSVPSALSVGGRTYEVVAVGLERKPVFKGCSDIVSVALPASVEKVGENALAKCPSLATVSVSAENEALASSDGLLFSKDLSELLFVPENWRGGGGGLPDQTVALSPCLFSPGSKVAALSVGEGNPAYSSADGILYSKDKTQLACCPPGSRDSVVIAESVEKILPGALAACNLREIVVAGKVESIGQGAFSDETKKQATVSVVAGEDYEARKSVWEQAGFSHFTEPVSADQATTDDRAVADDRAAAALSSRSLEPRASVSGVSGDCTWEIDGKGKLSIWPTDGSSGTLGTMIEMDGPPWALHRESIKSVSVASGVVAAVSVNSMFSGCVNLVSLDLSNFNTANVTDMSNMLSGCSKLDVLKLGELWKVGTLGNVGLIGKWGGERAGHNVPYEGSAIPTGGSDADAWHASKPYEIPPDRKATGESGGVTWYITSDADVQNPSRLVLFPTNGAFGTLGNIDGSAYAPWRDHRASIKSVSVSPGVAAAEQVVGMFYNFTNVASFDLANFDTSNVTLMRGMFNGCSSLVALDLSSLNTAKVTDFNSMFNRCKALTSLDVSSFDTSKVEDMQIMFSECINLGSLDLLKFNTSSVKNMQSMFYKCSSLASLDIGSFDTSNVTSMSNMFNGCSSLASLDLSNFNTANVTDMSNMLSGCSKLDVLKLGELWKVGTLGNVGLIGKWGGERAGHNVPYEGSAIPTGGSDADAWHASKPYEIPPDRKATGESGGVTWYITSDADVQNPSRLVLFPTNGAFGTLGNIDGSAYAPWESHRASIKSVSVSPGVAAAEQVVGMFYGFTNVASFDLANFDTSNVTNMSDMFYNCYKLTSLDLSGFDTSNVTNMLNMFNSCSSLTSLDLSGFGTTKVTNMGDMFSGCSSLTSLDLSGFDTANVTNMLNMFDSCSSLTSLNLSGFSTAKVSGMFRMFYNCSSLSSLNLSGFSTARVRNMSGMFSRCSSLTSLDLSGFDTTKVTNMSYMFDGCSSISYVSLGTGFSFDNGSTSCSLPAPYKADDTYTGKWQEVGAGSRDFPKGPVYETPGAIPSNKKADYSRERSKYAVSFDAEGGAPAPSAQSITYCDKATKPVPDPAKTGYTFDGWYTAATGGSVYDFNTQVTQDVALYARWSAETYAITYDLKGGSASGNPTSYTIESDASTLKNPTRTGCTFVGWTGSNGETPQTSVTIPKGSTGSKTYTANWEVQLSVTAPLSPVIAVDATTCAAMSDKDTTFQSQTVEPVKINSVSSATIAGSNGTLRAFPREGQWSKVKLSVSATGAQTATLALDQAAMNLTGFTVPAATVSGALITPSSLPLEFALSFEGRVELGYAAGDDGISFATLTFAYGLA